MQVRRYFQEPLVNADQCCVQAATRDANADSLVLEPMAQT